MSKIHFDLPGADEPGFLRRSRRALELQEQLSKLQVGSIPSSVIDDLIEFLADYVTEPQGRDEAKEALLDASQNQFMEMLNAITGTDNSTNPTFPNPRSSA